MADPTGKRPKMPRDIHELGVTVAKIATGRIHEEDEIDSCNPLAVEPGLPGGVEGQVRTIHELVDIIDAAEAERDFIID